MFWYIKEVKCLLLALLRPRGGIATYPLNLAEQTLNPQCPLFQKIGLHAEAQPTWFASCTWSHFDQSGHHPNVTSESFVRFSDIDKEGT